MTLKADDSLQPRQMARFQAHDEGHPLPLCHAADTELKCRCLDNVDMAGCDCQAQVIAASEADLERRAEALSMTPVLFSLLYFSGRLSWPTSPRDCFPILEVAYILGHT